MAKLKLLKLPKAPKLPKKPKATASLAAKQNWLERVKKLKHVYETKVSEVKKINARRQADHKKGEQLTNTISRISGIGSVGKISSHRKRKPAKKSTSFLAGHKRRAKKKAAPKRKRR